MILTIDHVTRYTYESESTYSIQTLRLTPAPYDGLRVLEWEVGVDQGEIQCSSIDGFGNRAHLVTVESPHREIAIRASGRVEVDNRDGLVLGLPRDPVPRVFLRSTSLTEVGENLAELAESCSFTGPLDFLHALCSTLAERLEYKTGSTDSATTAAESMDRGQGVCQDFAHAFIACARHMGIPARYVTGYLLDSLQGSSEAHHAWAEAWIQDLGWTGFDVTHGICPTDQYVRLACGLDALSATPLRGSRRGGDDETLEVSVEVRRDQSQQ